MHNVLVLGVSGMLGSMVFDYLNKDKGITVYGTVRNTDALPYIENVFKLDVTGNAEKAIQNILQETNPAYVINCIGVIKPWCKDDNPIGTFNAIHINARFPYVLSQVTSSCNKRIKIIQIATDCVFDGSKGNYIEKDLHNALDVYGKTKSLGEVIADNFLNVRCSIIGPEIKNKVSLLEWFLSNDDGATVKGFLHHTWNGVTTLQFARLMKRIILEEQFEALRKMNHVLHYIENESVNKFELLTLFNTVFKRKITIEPTNSVGIPIHRTLDSVYLHPTQKRMEVAIKELYHYITKSKIFYV